MLKSNSIEVFFQKELAGELKRLKGGFQFTYKPEYLEGSDRYPISCNLPLNDQPFITESLHPFFEGLAPQGWYKKGLETVGRINKNDLFTILGVNGADLPGAVTLKATDIQFPENEESLWDSEVSDRIILGKGHCLICCRESQSDYHTKCLNEFFGYKKEPVVPIKSDDFKQRMYQYISRASISGMQTKVGANLINGVLVPQAVNSRFILKPPISEHDQSAVYEYISMLISKNILGKGKVADSAVIKLADGKLAYLTKRFDRHFKQEAETPSKNIHFEDLSQIIGIEQFDGSYELAGQAILKHSNKIVLNEFLSALLAQFYLGNNDFHLKNIALMGLTKSGKYEDLSPLYDCINVESLLRDTGRQDEMAISYFADDDFYTDDFLVDGHASFSTFKHLYEIFGIKETVLKKALKLINSKHAQNLKLVEASILSEADKESFCYILKDRLKKLNKHSY
jgi:serine/threonine-protein kinase HipA